MRNTGYIILGLALSSTFVAAVAQEATPRESTIYTFSGSEFPEGASAYGGLVIGPGGVLYGTTEQGGVTTSQCPVSPPTGGCGTVYQLTPPSGSSKRWTETTLYAFGSEINDGYYPYASLTMGPDGVLYGTTQFGGLHGCGTVFQLLPPVSPGVVWTESALYNFGGGVDGCSPTSALALDSNGVLYGTTLGGGGNGQPGIVFSLTPPTWDELILHTFTGQNGDGSYPYAGVVIGAGGVLYGTTDQGGSLNYGTVYALTPPSPQQGLWTETIVHSFTGYSGDGAGIFDVPTLGTGGLLYVTASGGGANGLGTVIQLTPPSAPGGNWKEKTIYSFTGGTGGNDHSPSSGVTLGPNGVLYGATSEGEVFELKPPLHPQGNWREVFTVLVPGGNYSPLALDSNGTLYGTGTDPSSAFKVVP